MATDGSGALIICLLMGLVTLGTRLGGVFITSLVPLKPPTRCQTAIENWIERTRRKATVLAAAYLVLSTVKSAMMNVISVCRSISTIL